MELTSEGGAEERGENAEPQVEDQKPLPSLKLLSRTCENLNQSASPITEPSDWLGPHSFSYIATDTTGSFCVPKTQCENQISRLGGTQPQISREQAKGFTDFSQADSRMPTSEDPPLSGSLASKDVLC